MPDARSVCVCLIGLNLFSSFFFLQMSLRPVVHHHTYTQVTWSNLSFFSLSNVSFAIDWSKETKQTWAWEWNFGYFSDDEQMMMTWILLSIHYSFQSMILTHVPCCNNNNNNNKTEWWCMVGQMMMMMIIWSDNIHKLAF